MGKQYGLVETALSQAQRVQGYRHNAVGLTKISTQNRMTAQHGQAGGKRQIFFEFEAKKGAADGFFIAKERSGQDKRGRSRETSTAQMVATGPKRRTAAGTQGWSNPWQLRLACRAKKWRDGGG